MARVGGGVSGVDVSLQCGMVGKFRSQDRIQAYASFVDVARQTSGKPERLRIGMRYSFRWLCGSPTGVL